MLTRSSNSPVNTASEGDAHSSSGKKAFWTTTDESKLIQFFIDNKDRMTSHMGSLYVEVATHLEVFREKGVPKNKTSCKSKLKSVCIS